MLRKRIIVCLDVDGARVVKGTRFQQLRHVGDPVALARRYEKEGADEVVFLDISASNEGRRTVLQVVQQTAECLFVPLTVGGGIRELEDISNALRAGADKVSINTAIVARPELITAAAKRFGSQCIVASIDAVFDHATGAAGSYLVFTHGGRQPTELDAVEWARECAARGAGEILLTSIDRDGSRIGFELQLTRRVVKAVKVPVVASGGAGNPDHFVDVFRDAHVDAALAAGIFHDDSCPITEVKATVAAAGIPVRRSEPR